MVFLMSPISAREKHGTKARYPFRTLNALCLSILRFNILCLFAIHPYIKIYCAPYEFSYPSFVLHDILFLNPVHHHRLINVKALISSRYIVKFELWKILEKIYYEK